MNRKTKIDYQKEFLALGKLKAVERIKAIQALSEAEFKAICEANAIKSLKVADLSHYAARAAVNVG